MNKISFYIQQNQIYIAGNLIKVRHFISLSVIYGYRSWADELLWLFQEQRADKSLKLYSSTFTERELSFVFWSVINLKSKTTVLYIRDA